jgi:hypothetical protein
MHAVLYLLEPIPGAEEFSAGWEKRMENLKRVSDTCEKHGLKLYLYLNEPRTMPDAFYDKKPEWRGIKSLSGIANCISRTPEVLHWLEHACGDLFARRDLRDRHVRKHHPLQLQDGKTSLSLLQRLARR